MFNHNDTADFRRFAIRDISPAQLRRLALCLIDEIEARNAILLEKEYIPPSVYTADDLLTYAEHGSLFPVSMPRPNAKGRVNGLTVKVS